MPSKITARSFRLSTDGRVKTDPQVAELQASVTEMAAQAEANA